VYIFQSKIQITDPER